MKITRQGLLDKLNQIDQRLLDIWLVEKPELGEEETWELFLVLLETRVEILKSCRDAGLKISPEDCTPAWLDKLVTNRQELKLREIRKMAFEMQRAKKISTYDVNSRMFGPSSEVEL
jgi:hypothetical protein